METLDDCFTDHFPLLLDFSILGKVERTERGFRDLSLLECPRKPIEFEVNLIAEFKNCYKSVESSGDANLAYKRFHYSFTEVFDKLVPYRKKYARSKTNSKSLKS